MDSSEALADSYRLALQLTPDPADHRRILDDINLSIRRLEAVRAEAEVLVGYGDVAPAGGPDGFR